MTVDLAALGGWRAKYELLYGGSAGITLLGDGKCTIPHIAGNAQVLAAQFTTARTIKCVMAASFKTADAGDSAGVQRIILENVIETFPSTIKLVLGVEWVSSTTFKFYLTDDDALGDTFSATTTFAYGTEYTLRLITDGTNWILDVDGAEEISFADTRRMDFGVASETRFRAEGTADAGATETVFGPVALIAYDTSADRISADFASGKLALDGESADAGHDDFTHDHSVAGGDSHDDPDYRDVDDFETGTLEEGSEDPGGYNKHPGGITNTTFRQAYTCAGYTIVNATQWLVLHHRTKVNVGGKSETENAYIVDNGDYSTVIDAPTYVPTTSYLTSVDLFKTEPGGGAWTTAKFGTVELGCCGITGGTADAVYLSAFYGEVWDYDADPPAAATFVPRVMVF